MENYSKYFASAVRLGEYAGDTSKGGRYSRALLDAAEILKYGGKSDQLFTIKDVHIIAEDTVTSQTDNKQHPTLYPNSSILFPPFVVA